MTKYIGAKCPVCSQKFGQSDDIVVCPVCGAPHHRECYWKEGECAFAQEHASGKEWRPPEPEPKTPEDALPFTQDEASVRVCPSCQNANPAGNIFCARCGSRLNGQNAGQAPPQNQGGGWTPFGPFAEINSQTFIYGGLSPEEVIGGETVKDLASFVGENTIYFLPRFREIARTGRAIAPNLAALIFNFVYYFYRKMYMAGFILLALAILTVVPGFLYSLETMPDIIRQMESNELFAPTVHQLQELGWDMNTPVDRAAADRYASIYNAARLVNLGIGIAVSFNANRMYCKKALSKVKRIRESSTAPGNQYSMELSRAGGCSRGGVIAVLAACAVGYVVFATLIVSMVLGGSL